MVYNSSELPGKVDVDGLGRITKIYEAKIERDSSVYSPSHRVTIPRIPAIGRADDDCCPI